MSSRVFVSYVGAQALFIGAFFMFPTGGWIATALQIIVGWMAAAFALIGSRNSRMSSSVIWYLFAAGLFLNSSGILVEQILERYFGAPTSPNLSDTFFLSLFPCFIASMAILVYRRSSDDETGGLGASTTISSVITIGMGLVAWELAIVPQVVVQEVSVIRIMVVTAYPLGDLVLFALALRLLFSGGLNNPAFGLMLASLLCFLGADIGWVVPLRTGEPLGASVRHVLAATSLSAYALMGAALCHPAFRVLAQKPPKGRPHATPAVLGSLVVSLLIAPTVLVVEAVLDKLYGGGR